MPVTPPKSGRIDMALTQLVTGFSQGEFVAEDFLPRVPVDRKTDKFWQRGKEFLENIQKTLRATGAPAERIRFELSQDSYNCESHALGADIPDEDEQEYKVGNLKQESSTLMMEKILLAREIAAAALLTDTAKVTNNVTLAGQGQWSDAINSAPASVVGTAQKNIKLQSGKKANIMMITPDVLEALKVNEEVRDSFKYTNSNGVISLQQLASFFNIERIVEASGIKRVAGANSFIWGKDVLLAYVSPAPTTKDASGAKTFVWRNGPGTVNGIGVVEDRHPDPTAKSTILGVDFYYDQKIVSVESLYLIKNAVA